MQYNRCKLMINSGSFVLLFVVFTVVFVFGSCDYTQENETTNINSSMLSSVPDKNISISMGASDDIKGHLAERFSSDFTSVLRENNEKTVKQDDVLKIQSGMTLGEVVDIIGYPQREVGYGRIILEWDTFDGQKVNIVVEKNLRSENIYDSIVSEMTQIK